MRNRETVGIVLYAAGLSVAVVGVAMGLHHLTFTGLFAIAVTFRLRRRPPFWDYLTFLVLALAIFAFVLPSSPLTCAIPLMLSYVLDYFNEQREKRVAPAQAPLAACATTGEPLTEPNGGSVKRPGNSEVAEGPPSASKSLGGVGQDRG